MYSGPQRKPALVIPKIVFPIIGPSRTLIPGRSWNAIPWLKVATTRRAMIRPKALLDSNDRNAISTQVVKAKNSNTALAMSQSATERLAMATAIMPRATLARPTIVLCAEQPST